MMKSEAFIEATTHSSPLFFFGFYGKHWLVWMLIFHFFPTLMKLNPHFFLMLLFWYKSSEREGEKEREISHSFRRQRKTKRQISCIKAFIVISPSLYVELTYLLQLHYTNIKYAKKIICNS